MASASAGGTSRSVAISHRAGTGELDAKLEEVVAALLAQPAEALRATQKLLRTAAKEEILARMKLESSMFAERLDSAEVKDAIGAFFAKRATKSD